MKGVFITGTGTEVGKTMVAAAVLRSARLAGIDAAPLKPVQTGASRGPAGLIAPDVEFCLAAAGLDPSPDERAMMAPCLYEPACSPHLAARIEGRPVDEAAILAAARGLIERRDALIVEGAGGVMVPLSESRTMLDLMADLAMPVVVAALDSLGTINHTLLTLAALRAAKLDVLGVVFNRPAPTEPVGDKTDQRIRRDNPEIISRLGGVDVLGLLPYAPGLEANGPTGWRAIEGGFHGMPAILERLEAQ